MRICSEIRLCLLITVSARSLEPMNNACMLSVSLEACLSKGQCPHPTAMCPVLPELHAIDVVYTSCIINRNKEEIESELNERDALSLVSCQLWRINTIQVDRKKMEKKTHKS